MLKITKKVQPLSNGCSPIKAVPQPDIPPTPQPQPQPVYPMSNQLSVIGADAKIAELSAEVAKNKQAMEDKSEQLREKEMQMRNLLQQQKETKEMINSQDEIIQQLNSKVKSQENSWMKQSQQFQGQIEELKRRNNEQVKRINDLTNDNTQKCEIVQALQQEHNRSLETIARLKEQLDHRPAVDQLFSNILKVSADISQICQDIWADHSLPSSQLYGICENNLRLLSQVDTYCTSGNIPPRIEEHFKMANDIAARYQDAQVSFEVKRINPYSPPIPRSIGYPHSFVYTVPNPSSEPGSSVALPQSQMIINHRLLPEKQQCPICNKYSDQEFMYIAPCTGQHWFHHRHLLEYYIVFIVLGCFNTLIQFVP